MSNSNQIQFQQNLMQIQSVLSQHQPSQISQFNVNTRNNNLNETECNEEYQYKIDSLLSILEENFTSKTYEIDFQLAYSKSHEICLNRMAKELYQAVIKLVSEIVSSYQETLIKLEGNNLISTFVEMFNFFIEKVEQTSDILSYLERVKQRYNMLNCEPIYSSSVSIFYKEIIIEGTLKEKVLNTIITEYKSLRKGIDTNTNKTNLIKEFLNILTNQTYAKEFYVNDLLPSLKSETKIHYEEIKQTFISKINSLNNNKSALREETKSFILQCKNIFNQEENLLSSFPDKSDILSIIYDLLITSNNNLLYDKGFKHYFKENNEDMYKITYNLIFNEMIHNSNSNEAISFYYNKFTEMLSKILKKLTNDFVISKQGHKIEFLNFTKYIEDLCELRKKLNLFYKNSMKQNQKAEHIIKTLFEKQINQHSEFLTAFTKLLHEEIKLSQKIRNSKRIKDFSYKFLTVFKLLNDKDLFEIEYRKNLAKRLIRNSSMLMETEVEFYTIMKKESGNNYVKKIESMFNDIFFSQNTNLDFRLKQKTNTNNIPIDIDFSVKVLSKDNWPIEEGINTKMFSLINNTDINNNVSSNINKIDLIIKENYNSYPQQLKNCISSFSNYYYTKFANRNIFFIPELSWGELFINMNNRTYTFIVSTFQMLILLLFNEKKNQEEGINLNEIAKMFKVKEAQVKEISYPLLKIKIIRMDGDKFLINKEFIIEENKINLNYKCKKKNDKGEDNKENNEISHFVVEDRKYQLDANLMHLMKKHKQMNFNELKDNVIKAVSAYFIPEISIIKARLDYLVDMNFLEKNKDNKDVYIYIV